MISRNKELFPLSVCNSNVSTSGSLCDAPRLYSTLRALCSSHYQNTRQNWNCQPSWLSPWKAPWGQGPCLIHLEPHGIKKGLLHEQILKMVERSRFFFWQAGFRYVGFDCSKQNIHHSLRNTNLLCYKCDSPLEEIIGDVIVDRNPEDRSV